MDGRWDSVPFGLTLEDTATFVEKSLRWRHREALGTKDQSARDALEARLESDAKAFREGLVAFQGQRTGYNISVIDRDFAHDAGESMAVISVEKSHDYFFFQGGRLWKLVTTDASKQSFSALLVALTAALGAPAAIEYADAKKTEPVSARWVSDAFTVEAESKPQFSTRLVRWTWRAIGDNLKVTRGEKLPPGEQKTETMDPAILDIMNPD